MTGEKSSARVDNDRKFTEQAWLLQKSKAEKPVRSWLHGDFHSVSLTFVLLGLLQQSYVLSATVNQYSSNTAHLTGQAVFARASSPCSHANDGVSPMSSSARDQRLTANARARAVRGHGQTWQHPI